LTERFYLSIQPSNTKEKLMFIKKSVLRAAGASLAAVALLAAQPLRAESSSDTTRIEKLERAVELLAKQNVELQAEIKSLKKETASVPDGKFKKKVTYDGKTYVEKAVVEEKAPVYVQQRGPELKLVLGGFIQMNFEDGDVSAFEGRFGQTALKDRFRLRRARINLTGDFTEQFDFKLEGDFENSDGLNANRTAFEATDSFISWHLQWKRPEHHEQRQQRLHVRRQAGVHLVQGRFWKGILPQARRRHSEQPR